MTDYRQCPTPGCTGDVRYTPPGRGHMSSCKYNGTPDWEIASETGPAWGTELGTAPSRDLLLGENAALRGLLGRAVIELARDRGTSIELESRKLGYDRLQGRRP